MYKLIHFIYKAFTINSQYLFCNLPRHAIVLGLLGLQLHSELLPSQPLMRLDSFQPEPQYCAQTEEMLCTIVINTLVSYVDGWFGCVN